MRRFRSRHSFLPPQREREPRPSRPRLQFSKKMCLLSWWLMTLSVFICIGGEFYLQYTQLGSMREIVTIILSLISFVTVFINGGYITQNIFRDTSLNKHKIHVCGDRKYMIDGSEEGDG